MKTTETRESTSAYISILLIGDGLGTSKYHKNDCRNDWCTHEVPNLVLRSPCRIQQVHGKYICKYRLLTMVLLNSAQNSQKPEITAH